MNAFLRTVLCAGLLAFALAGPAGAAKRVALVIGNDRYESLSPLEKAVNDARAVAEALEDIGFKVFLGEDMTRRETNRKLADFEAAIEPGDTAFFFFAGHGVALGAENYLIPSDMPKPGAGEEGLVRDEGYSVSALVERVRSRGAASAFFVLDACRDNPFAEAGVRSIGGTRGLTRTSAPSGVFMLFSAGIGQTALDRLPGGDPDPNSVFTRKLVPLLKTPGLSHVTLAKRVQQEVSALAASVPHPQQPAYYDQIIGEIVLSPGVEPALPPRSEASPPPVAPVSQAAQAWATIQNSASPAVLEAYIREFPDSVYATFAKARLGEMREQEVAVAVPQAAEPAAPPAAAPPSSSLSGFRIWVNSKEKDIANEVYCSKLRDAGMTVECDVTNPELGNWITENLVYLKCSQAPDNTAEILESILGVGAIGTFDWRDDPEYAESCNSYDAIDLKLVGGVGNQHAAAESQPPQPTGTSYAALSGFQVWVTSKNKNPQNTVYCDKLAAAGLDVECDVANPSYGQGIVENNIMLQCSELPANAGEMLAEITGIADLRTYDWRDNPGFQNCDTIFELSLQIIGD